ncbi:MAG: hypothetical protein KJO41_01630 [Bacteroidia bacterium]|nr:hypothetical protein [Bacteroidia bacterium]NND25976.1 hypothetical protein [Flavobacteriaceae bacterium]MBT8277673.1 hypothetical protein [Bacteroidia bacterium]NNK59193.1 hypothetical protein [Flavobacteriaceae bacterium]NNL32361.1 hypothetical protein [Flavobacteriaceae bacterium]
MKNIFKLTFLLSAILLTVTSCSEDDKVVDDVLAGITNGAVLRGVTTFENEIPVPVGMGQTPKFSILLEEQDYQDGDLLESVNIYVSFEDGSPDEGDSSAAATGEVSYMTLQASDFFEGPFGLPRYQLDILYTDFISAVGLAGPDNIAGGDVFTTRLELNLTDGRVFSVDNAGGIITGGFFNSPFQYLTPVVCPVENDFFIGDYLGEQTAPSIFGYDTFDPDGGGVIITFYNAETAVDENGDGILTQPAEVEALTSTQRAFDGDYLAALGFGNTRTYVIDFVCNEVVFPTGQTTGLTCGGPGITLGPPSVNGGYDFTDDTVWQMNFFDDEAADCGGGVDAGIQFTKQ